MKKAATLSALLLASIALVACGSSDNSTTGSETEAAGGEGAAKPAKAAPIVQLATPAGAELAYTTNSATTEAGEVSIEFTNPQELKHDVAIEDSSGKVLGETELVENGSTTATVDLKPGEYTFFCTVPGHRQAGMEGTLTVE